MGDAVGTGAGVAVNGEVARAVAPGAAGSGMGVVSLVRLMNRTVTNPNRPPYRTDRSSGDSATSIRRVGKQVVEVVAFGAAFQGLLHLEGDVADAEVMIGNLLQPASQGFRLGPDSRGQRARER